MCIQCGQALSCSASGHLQLAVYTNNPGVVSMVGVKCQPGGKLEGYPGKQSSYLNSSTKPELTTCSYRRCQTFCAVVYNLFRPSGVKWLGAYTLKVFRVILV